MFSLSGFNTKRFTHHYCLSVLFLGCVLIGWSVRSEWAKHVDVTSFAERRQISSPVVACCQNKHCCKSPKCTCPCPCKLHLFI